MTTFTNDFISTNVASATWDDQTGKLEVSFVRDGTTYTYYNVPETLWKKFVQAPSPGRFVLSELKGKYG